MHKQTHFSCPSGFPEFLPGEKRLELYLLDTIRQVFERYGFTPIETPAIERLEILQAKGNQGDNIIYGINPILPNVPEAEKALARSKGEERGLKFDQTVPLAAYIARHLNELTFPFARYQMDMVFRGERAKDGRYRQFRQCDIDVVGRGKLSLLYDAQIPAIIAEIFEAIEIGDFLIRINNRKILTGFFQSIGLVGDKIASSLRIIDGAEKMGIPKVKAALTGEGLSPEQVEKVLAFTSIGGTVDEVLAKLKDMAANPPLNPPPKKGGSSSGGDSSVLNEGIKELETVITGVGHLGVPSERFSVDLSIARGLDYYTGTVYETTLIGNEGLGSICSGGRYEGLVGTFVGEKMPGVGISIGLTRLMSRLLKGGILKSLSPTPTQVMVVNMSEDLIPLYLQVSQQLRQGGLNAVTNFDKRPLKKQLQQADRLGIPFCVIIGEVEASKSSCGLKDMRQGEQIDVSLGELVPEVLKRL